MEFNFDAPINSVSFGHVSIKILEELYKKGENPNLFLTNNNFDFSAYKTTPDFEAWLNSCSAKARKSYSRKIPTFKLWHINGAEASISDNQTLFTFHEVDSLTDEEIHILNNQNKIIVSSNRTKEVFQEFGVTKEIIFCPLGFDTTNFYKKDTVYHPEEVALFSIFGKMEKRKGHFKAIKAWLKKYGNKPNIYLNMHIYNPFFSREQNDHMLNQLTEGVKYFNINALPFVKTLKELNDSFNACDIVIDASGGEGWSLPSFHCLGLGKYGVIHNCSAMKEWANDENSCLFEPNGVQPVYDGIFFGEGQQFNQGNLYTFDDSDFINACEKALSKYRMNRVNSKGLELQKKFTWEHSTDIILKALE